MGIEIVRASPAHIGRIANKMRPDDVLECAAMGYSPKQALRQSMLTSEEAWTAKVDGVPEAMFGLVITNALCGVGRPWMLGSEAIYRHPRAMIRGGEIALNRWLDSSRELSNYVSTGNHRAIRMLRRWGCKIEEGGDLMFAGVRFVRFSLERE